MSYKVYKHTKSKDGESVEEVATFDNAVRAEEYTRTLTTMELGRAGFETWFTYKESERPITQVHVYRLTETPLKDGFMNILQDMRPIFPRQTGKITANLEGMTDKQLLFDSKNNRVFGLSKWYRQRGARAGDYVDVTVLKPFEYYLFQIIKATNVGGQSYVDTSIKTVKSTLPQAGAIFGDRVFVPYKYGGTDGESKLEEAVIQNYRKALGEGALYLPIKKLVGTEFKKVTDGLVVDVNDPNDPSFWIVEVELSSHDLESHVQRQLMGFLTALEEEKTKRSLLKVVYEYVEKKSDDAWNVNYFVPAWEGAHSMPYQFLEELLHRQCGLLVIIDEVTPKLQALMGILSKLSPVKVVEFRTLVKDGEFLHYFSHVADLKKR